MRPLLILLTLTLPACQALRDRWDLYFVVPQNPFGESQVSSSTSQVPPLSTPH